LADEGTASMALDRHSVYHPELMKALFRDEFDPEDIPQHIAQESPLAFFVRFINFNFNVFAAQYACRVTLSERRTHEAHTMWRHDLLRALQDSESGRIDQYKRAGFLCCWLSRRIVVDEISPVPLDELPSGEQRDRLRRHLSDFMQYGNELCPFLLGYHFCLRFVASSAPDSQLDSVIAAYRLGPSILREIAVYVKAKNVSHHALGLMYKLIFRPLPTIPVSHP
jgi:hypothetical protein